MGTLHDALLGLAGLEEHQVVLTKADGADPYSADVLVVRAAVGGPDRPRVGPEIARRARAACEVTVVVEFVAADHFAARLPDYKFMRFLDERPADGRLT